MSPPFFYSLHINYLLIRVWYYYGMGRPNPLTIPEKRQQFIMSCVFMGRKRALRCSNMDYPSYRGYLKKYPEESAKLDEEIEVAKANFVKMIAKTIKDKVNVGRCSMRDLIMLMQKFEPEVWQDVKRVEHRHSGGINLLNDASEEDKKRIKANIIEVLDEGRAITSGDATGSGSNGSKSV